MTSYSESFDRNFKLLTYLGLWDLNTNNISKNWIYCCYQIFSLLFLISFIILEYIDLYVIRNDIEKFNFNLCATVASTGTLIKTLHSLRKLPDINRFRHDFDKDPNLENNKEHRDIILKASFEMKSLTNFFYGLTTVLIIIWSLTPLLDYKSGDRKLPLRQWYPYDIQITPNYELTYLYQVISLTVVASNVVASDMMVWCFMISIIAEYEILENDIWKLNEVYEKHFDSFLKDEMTMKIFKNVVAHHQQIILRVREFENVFNITNMCQIATITLLFAIIGFDVIVESEEINTKFFTQCTYLFTASVDLFFFCSYGTRLEQKSYDIVDTTFSTPWYLMKNRYRSYLVFIISKAQHPPIVTGGKLMHVNFIALLSVLKTTYNMLAVFRQVASNSKK